MTEDRTLVGGIAGRYAIALFELAEEAKALDAVEKDLSALRGMIAQSADLARLVRSPLFARDDQAKAMAAILEKAGAHELTRKFIGLVARNRRLFALPDMARAFSRLLAEKRGEESARVRSARKLTGEQLSQLAERLKSSLGKDVRLETEVDEDLIGGLVVQVGSKLIDTSLRTKLENIHIVMREAG
ncbi:MAG: F0F1 ATP synthase subunit delta [Alphaproteobacteria bacterium]